MSASDPRSSRRSEETSASSSVTPVSGSSTTSRKRRLPTPSSQAERTATPALVANIDGGARGNPGTAGFGVYIQDETGREVASLYGYLGHQTNNVAEYAALLAVLRYAVDHKLAGLTIRSDSELLVRQISGQYRVKNLALQRLHGAALALMRKVGRVTVEHVRREQNKDADRLANVAMDTRSEAPMGVTTGLLKPE